MFIDVSQYIPVFNASLNNQGMEQLMNISFIFIKQAVHYPADLSNGEYFVCYEILSYILMTGMVNQFNGAMTPSFN